MHVLLSHLHLALILCALFFGAREVQAQPQSRLVYCLTAAQDAQISAYAEREKFITNEAELKKLMLGSCKDLRYEIMLKSSGGFRVVSEWNNETWSIDENGDFVKVASLKTTPGSAPASTDGGAASAPRTPAAASKASAPAPAAPRSSDPQPGKPNAIPDPPNRPLARAVPPAGGSDEAGATPPAQLADEQAPAPSAKTSADASAKLAGCLTKPLFSTKPCTVFFEQLEKTCWTDNAQLSKLCLDFEGTLKSVHLEDCETTDSSWGKCEMKKRQLSKKCTNELKQNSGECRDLTKFLARVQGTSPTAGDEQAQEQDKNARAPAKAPPAAEAAAAPVPSRVPMTLAPREEIPQMLRVQTLDPSLRALLRLRPVTYQTKESNLRQYGFVPAEVAAVEPGLVTYDPAGQPLTIKSTNFTALITSGMQELYGLCRVDTDLHKELIRRVVSVESENSQLKTENAALKKQLIQMGTDLQLIKEKLRLK